MTGTARYASINTHLGVEQSRRDDVESIIYLFLYFLKGALPWQGIPAKDKDDKYNKIMEAKILVTPDCLCEGLPCKVKTLLKYVLGLKFEEEPNYGYMKGILKAIADENNFTLHDPFDWHKYENTKLLELVIKDHQKFEEFNKDKSKPKEEVKNGSKVVKKKDSCAII